MRKISKLGILLLLFSIAIVNLISLIPVTTFAEASWIPFVSRAEPSTRLQVLPKSADTMGLCVDSNFYGMYNIEATINETTYNRLHMPGAGYATVIGKPAVPMVTRFLEIPDGVDVSVDVLYREVNVLEGFNVIPAQEPRADHPDAMEPPFTIDETTYMTDEFYPLDIASLEGGNGTHSIIIRGRRIVALSLYPVQFNPVTQQLQVFSKIEVKIKYNEPSQVGAIDRRLSSSAFESLYEAMILNYNYRPPKLLTKGEDKAEYLIITHDDFYNEVQDLAAWKQRKGLMTKVVKTSQIKTAGPTADDIADYIQDAYNMWDPAPSFVLLVGDTNFVPTHYRTDHPTKHNDYGWSRTIKTGTDLYYGTVEGDDLFSDIYVGRLSVENASQANIVIDKILSYERNPLSPDLASYFYTSIAAAAQFQDGSDLSPEDRDGYEDRRFILTSEEVRDFLTSSMAGSVQGYNVDRIYWARDPDGSLPDGQIPLYYNDGDYNNGDRLPADLWWPTFAWDGDTGDIIDAINAGRFLVYHRNHGTSRNNLAGYDGWGHPSFTTDDVADLTNQDLYPVILSVECMGGWFDGETDYQQYENYDSLCEELVRKEGGGAIGAIGSSRISHSGWNDDLFKGFIDAIWPDFNPDFMSGGLFSLGQVLTYGKMYMANYYDLNDEHTIGTFEYFNLIGDPELAIWTNPPGKLTVSHPMAIGSGGMQRFAVSVLTKVEGAFGPEREFPVPNAKVCLQKGSDVYEAVYTDPSGHAYFDIFPDSGGEMSITVTAHNYHPYEGIIAVGSDGASLSVSPSIGPIGMNVGLEGSNFDHEEEVEVYFGNTTPEITFTASGGTFSETLVVPDGAIGPINVVAVGKTSSRRAVEMFRRLPEQPLPDPYIYCQWDSDTWHLNPDGGDPRWNNPDIQLFDANTGDQVASNDLIVGKKYIIKAIIHNEAAVDATDTVVTFQWAFIGAGQTNWYLIDHETITVPDGGQENAEVEWTPSITGHICIQASIYHPWDENPNNNIGQENMYVHPVASPGEITFTVNNPTEKSALVYIEAKQVGTQDLWETRIERDYPQVQAPNENKTATLIVEAPPDADEGETRIFTVSGYVDGELIGGIEVEVVVDRSGQVNWCLIFPILIVILIVVILFLIRRRGWKEKLLGIIIIAIAIILYLLQCVLKIWV